MPLRRTASSYSQTNVQSLAHRAAIRIEAVVAPLGGADGER